MYKWYGIERVHLLGSIQNFEDQRKIHGIYLTLNQMNKNDREREGKGKGRFWENVGGGWFCNPWALAIDWKFGIAKKKLGIG